MSKELRVWTDGYDTVIAADPEHATKVWEATIGELRSSHRGVGEWRAVPAEVPIAIRVDLVLGGREFGEVLMTKTAEEWAKVYGAGFLCSTET